MSNRFKISHETSFQVSVRSWVFLLLCTLVLIQWLCASVESVNGCAAWHCVWEPEKSWHVEHVWSCWRWSMTGHMFEYPGCSGRAARPWVPPLGLQLVWLLCFRSPWKRKVRFALTWHVLRKGGKVEWRNTGRMREQGWGTESHKQQRYEIWIRELLCTLACSERADHTDRDFRCRSRSHIFYRSILERSALIPHKALLSGFETITLQVG